MRSWSPFLLCAVLWGSGGPLAADSPLTSTDLATAYSDLAAVKQARETRRVEGEVLAFLAGDRPIDQKAAVVNALGWQARGTARGFVDGLARARGIEPAELKLAQLSAADRFVLGYLRALETYLEPAPLQAGALDLWGATPLQLLDQATQSLPDDFTVHYVRALLEAQRAMADSGCSAYTATARVLDRFPPRKRNLRPKAVASAQAYMELYKADCSKAPLSPPKAGAATPLTAEHDQVYSLARLGDTIVAGTQAGIVVWGADRKRPLSSRDERICSHVLVWHDSAWAACYGRVVRWDGKTWRAYLPDPGASEAYAPLVDAEGGLLVYRGADVWRYGAENDRFVPTEGFEGPTYDALYRRNGNLWRVDFMRAVAGPWRHYALSSRAYPGRDPRQLIEDAEGRLWIADFSDGLFRLDDETGDFLPEPVVTEKAVTVAVDKARGRTFLAHYTEGVRVQQAGHTEPIDLSELGYTRDLLLDEGNGDLWVAGWNGIARLRESMGAWTREYWRVSPGPPAKPGGPPRKPKR